MDPKKKKLSFLRIARDPRYFRILFVTRTAHADSNRDTVGVLSALELPHDSIFHLMRLSLSNEFGGYSTVSFFSGDCMKILIFVLSCIEI